MVEKYKWYYRKIIQKQEHEKRKKTYCKTLETCKMILASLYFPGGSEVKASTYKAGDPGSIPGLGRSLGEGNGNPLQYSCLENPMLEEPDRLQSMGSRRVGHDWATSLSLSRIGEGNGNPLQCSWLEKPRDGGAWWAAVYGVAQIRAWLKRLSSSSSSISILSFAFLVILCTYSTSAPSNQKTFIELKTVSHLSLSIATGT